MTAVLKRPGRPKNPEHEAKRKDEILAVAMKHFAEVGFADTDVQHIADELKLGKGTIYRYFPTKEALFLATVDRGLKELSAAIDAVLMDMTKDPIDAFEHAIVTYLSFFANKPEMAELFIQERAHFRDRHRPLYFVNQNEKHTDPQKLLFLKKLIQKGRFRGIPVQRVPEVIGDLLFGTVLSNHLAGRRVRPQTQAKDIVDVIFNGLLSDSEKAKRSQKTIRKPIMKPRIIPLLLLSAMFTGCGPKPASAPTGTEPVRPAIPVTVQTIQGVSMARTVEAVGTLTGYDETQLSAKVDGRVKRVFVDVGDSVVPGAPLLEIDNVDYALAESEAARALEAELARLGLRDIPSGAFDVSAVPAVKRTIAAAEDARRKLKQKEDLFKQKATSEDEVEVARTEMKLAEASVRQMETEAEATLAVAKLRLAALNQARQRLVDCIVTAPIPEAYGAWASVLGAGFTPAQFAVSARLVTEGEMLRSMPVTPVIRLVLDSGLKLRVTVPEKAQAEIALGQSVDVLVDAYPKTIFNGTVSRINPTVDSQARTMAVEIIVPNANRKLKAGSFANATIKTRIENNVMVVPSQAVVSFAGVSKVFVANGDTAKAVLVTVIPLDGEKVEIKGDLKVGDKVLTSGLTQVVDGSAIRIKE